VSEGSSVLSAAASAIGDSRCEPPDCPPLRGPTRGDRSPIHRLEPGCLISSFFPHTWWILLRLDGSHSLEAPSWRDVAGEIRLRRTGYWGPICTRDSGSAVGGGENYADLVRGGLVVAGFAAGDAIHEAVPANPYVHLRLAKAATLLAPTLVFWLLTLGAAVFGGAGSGGHEANVAR